MTNAGRLALLFTIAFAPLFAIADDIPTPTPVSTFTTPRTGDSKIAISPDFSRAYVITGVDTINLWQLLVSRWVELLGIGLAAYTVWTFRRALRIFHRRGVVGVSYCRACHYNLTGIGSSICPECGNDITGRGRKAGRPVGRPFKLAATLHVLLWALWALLEVASPRLFYTWRGPVLYADGLRDFAQENEFQWLLRDAVRTKTLSEVDPRTGSIVRRLDQVDLAIGLNDVAFSGDSKRLYVAKDEIVQEMDVATRKPLRSYAIAGASNKIQSILGVTDQRVTVDTSTSIVQWNTQSTELVKSGYRYWNASVFLDAKQDLLATMIEDGTIAILDAEWREVARLKTRYARILAIDGDTLYQAQEPESQDQWAPTVRQINWKTGDLIRSVQTRSRLSSPGRIQASALNRARDGLILMAMHDRAMYANVLDTKGSGAIRLVELPNFSAISDCVFSTDRQRVAIIGVDSKRSQEQIEIHDAAIFDLAK